MKICLYFQIHQPFRLKDYSFFRIGSDHTYGATQQNYAIFQRVADLCYEPVTEMLLKQANRHPEFKVSYAISGTALTQMEQYRPDLLDLFTDFANTGQCEFICETDYHSLAYLYNEAEFIRQVRNHKSRIQKLLNYDPDCFRNTELIYDDGLPALVAAEGFEVLLAEGVDRNLLDTHPNQVFSTAGGEMVCLLRNYKFSDDIAFRFTEESWGEYPLTATKFCDWIKEKGVEEGAEVINLFMDYETFGEHRKRETGIIDFLEQLPEAALAAGLSFTTPTEVARAAKAAQIAIKPGELETAKLKVYTAPEATSWADLPRDLSAWRSNAMQVDALKRVYALSERVSKATDTNVMEVWGRLQTSDHFYYMSTKYFNDAVHQSFSPYRTQYDAYINYMNVLTDFEQMLGT
jgi:alpha-amylase